MCHHFPSASVVVSTEACRNHCDGGRFNYRAVGPSYEVYRFVYSQWRIARILIFSVQWRIVFGKVYHHYYHHVVIHLA
jgi:hypothetical protein